MSTESDERYEGIQGFEVSSTLNPESIFSVVNTINTNTPPEDQVKIEIYPTTNRGIFGNIQDLAGHVGLVLPFPPEMDIDYIRNLQEKNPNAIVDQVHLGFTYNLKETLIKPFAEEGLGRKARSVLWGTFFGSANSMRSINLAHEIGANINAHVNVIEGFANDNKLDELRQTHALLLIENQTESSTNKERQSTLDPALVVEKYVIPHNLDGLVLGYDHDPENFVDHINDPLVRDHLRVVHFAAENHGMMSVDDPRIEQFAQELARVSFAHPVTVTFDIDPRELKKLSINEQVDYFKRTMNKMKSVQATEQEQ